MHLRSRLLAAGLVGGVAFGALAATTPASADTACTEPQEAIDARATVTQLIGDEIDQYDYRLDGNRYLVRTRVPELKAKAEDRRRTSSERGIARAELKFIRSGGALLKRTKAEAVADREELGTCGLPAMLQLHREALVRQRDWAIGNATLFRADGRAYLKWDTITRDRYKGVDTAKYKHWDRLVKTDRLLIDSTTDTIKELRKIFATELAKVAAPQADATGA